MKGFVIVLTVVNLLVFGLGQGWFGTVRSDLGRTPSMSQNQLNVDAVQISRGRLQNP